jgi:hypothetical protein
VREEEHPRADELEKWVGDPIRIARILQVAPDEVRQAKSVGEISK